MLIEEMQCPGGFMTTGSKAWIFQLGHFCGWQVRLCLAGMTEWVLTAQNKTDNNSCFFSASQGYWLLYHVCILLYFMYSPLHQASFHSVRVCVTDEALRALEAACNSLECGWRVVSTTPTNRYTKHKWPGFPLTCISPGGNLSWGRHQ